MNILTICVIMHADDKRLAGVSNVEIHTKDNSDNTYVEIAITEKMRDRASKHDNYRIGLNNLIKAIF